MSRPRLSVLKSFSLLVFPCELSYIVHIISLIGNFQDMHVLDKVSWDIYVGLNFQRPSNSVCFDVGVMRSFSKINETDVRWIKIFFGSHHTTIQTFSNKTHSAKCRTYILRRFSFTFGKREILCSGHLILHVTF